MYGFLCRNIYRNQGALIGGDSIEEAFASLAATVSACEQLLALAPLGLDNVYVLSPEEMAAIREEQKQQTKDHEPAIPADEDKVRRCYRQIKRKTGAS